MATTLHVCADARLERIRPLREVVANVARAEGFSETEVYVVRLCVSEALANAVKHAYVGSEPGPLDVIVRQVGGELVVVVADHGRPNRRARWEDHGGFGLSFLYRLTDGCTFTAASSGTSVEMRFPLPHRRSGEARELVEADEAGHAGRSAPWRFANSAGATATARDLNAARDLRDRDDHGPM
jgi:serine/threonine-protein kinase RsbW